MFTYHHTTEQQSTRFNSYEDLGSIKYPTESCVLESFKGSDIVDWHGRIEQSLVNLKKDAEKANNFTYKNRLETFLETWRGNPIDGSLNRETIEVLMAAAMQWAREEWDMQSYFLSLHTRLRQLVASEEELPRGMDQNQNEPPPGSHGHGAPPMSPEFGPDQGGPGGDDMGDGPGGGPGGPGAGAPGTPDAGGPGGPGGPGGEPGAPEGPDGLGAAGPEAAGGQALDAEGSDIEGGPPEEKNPEQTGRL